jgi:hypothetical protein
VEDHLIKRRDHLFAGHGRKIVEELTQRVPGLEVVQEGLKGDPRADEHGRAP